MLPPKPSAPPSLSSLTMPWSVKGVSEEARAIAKMKAQENGQTIGAWLTDTIMQGAAGSAVPRSFAPPRSVVPAAAPRPDPAIGELTRLMFAIAQRVATLEGDTVEFAASFQDQLSDVRRKVQVLQEVGYAPMARLPNNAVPTRTSVAP